MAGPAWNRWKPGWLSEACPGFLRFAGFRCWTASLLPALVGATLPFWLSPPGFSFRWLGAAEFTIAIVLLHAGFSFLRARLADRTASEWPGLRFAGAAGVCIAAAFLLGLHLTSLVPGSTFIVYGLSTIFTGVLYVAPPFSFYRRAGGEVVICEGLGLLPVLGAYLVQTGDLTRRVYLAALPLVLATALWCLTDELITGAGDERAGRQTMVVLFGPRFAGRFIAPTLAMLFYAVLFLAVLTSSIAPLALCAVLSSGLMWKIVAVSAKEYANPARMRAARSSVLMLHLVTCIVIAASSLAALHSWELARPTH